MAKKKKAASGRSVKVANKRTNKLKRRRNETEKSAKKQRQEKRAAKRKKGAKVNSTTAMAKKGIESKQQTPSAAPSSASASSSSSTRPPSGRGREDPVDREDNDSDREAMYERRPRRSKRWEREEKQRNRMPVKDSEGRAVPNRTRAMGVKSQQLETAEAVEDSKEEAAKEEEQAAEADSDFETFDRPESDENDEDDEEDDGDEEYGDSHEEKKNTAQMTKAEAAAMEFKLVHEGKEKLAEVGESILEDPDANIKRVDEIFKMLTSSTCVRVQQLALLTMIEVFTDVLPGYRIVLPSKEELKKVVTKQVARQRLFEGQLLRSYTKLVNLLVGKANKMRRRKKLTPFEMSVSRSLARLLHAAHLFNLRKDVIRGTIPLLNHPNEEVRKVVLGGVKRLFRADRTGDSTLEVVRLIAQIAVSQGHNVKGEMVATFLELHLSRDVIQGSSLGESKQELQKLSQKAIRRRKRNKAVDSKLEKDLEESSAVQDPKRLQKIQTQLLSHVFTTYFRVLKKFPTSSSLPVVLTGIAKFANLINIDLVLDLLQCLKALMRSTLAGGGGAGEKAGSAQHLRLSLRSMLHCLQAVFGTLDSHHGVITVDLMEYYKMMYQSLWMLAKPRNAGTVGLAIACLSKMLLRSNVPKDRLLAFAKRLLLVSLSLPAHGALAIVHLVNRVANKHPAVKNLIDTELPETLGIGVYQPELEDPDHANAITASAWEAMLHSASYHPYLSEYSKECYLKSKLPAVNPS